MSHPPDRDTGAAPAPPTPRQTHQFDAKLIEELLGALGRRLRQRSIAASVFIVGGAAIAVSEVRRDRLTADIDALTHPDVAQTVAEEARALAHQHGLPPDWLNPPAGMWMPPLPAGVLDPPPEPGLRATYADDGFLLATKLIAQRSRDAEDILALTQRLGLTAATPQRTALRLQAHIHHYYTDTGALAFLIDGNDVPTEIELLARDAARRIHRTATADHEDRFASGAVEEPPQR